MEPSDTVLHYADEEIDISYDAHRCIHATECIHGLPAVFEAQAGSWIAPSAASADEIANVIAKCPRGALHFKRRDGGPSETPQEPNDRADGRRTLVCARGRPTSVGGWQLGLRGREGGTLPMRPNKPFCDNSHFYAGFDDPGAVPESGVPAENKG
jgi:uncharacterized Fe-S cluster protein YjdI